MNVFSFGIGEDSDVFDIEYKSVNDFFENEGINYCGIFISKWDIELVESINVFDYNECWDYEGGEEEGIKFLEVVEKYSLFLKENDDYILVSCGVEYSSSWLLINKEDWVKLKELSIKSVDLDDLVN